jgi:hypothetical protein
MKRTVALAILGMAAVAVTTAYGQATFQFSNYTPAPPYSPIVYDASVPGVGGANVGAGEGVVIELWWAPGADQPEGSLVFEGAEANWSAFAGYTDRTQVFTIPGFSTGGGSPTTYTVQFRASGTAGGQAVDSTFSRGPLVNVGVAAQDVTPPELSTLTVSDGFTVFVPEPSTFALAGLGAAALMIFRRRD